MWKMMCGAITRDKCAQSSELLIPSPGSGFTTPLMKELSMVLCKKRCDSSLPFISRHEFELLSWKLITAFSHDLRVHFSCRQRGYLWYLRAKFGYWKTDVHEPHRPDRFPDNYYFPASMAPSMLILPNFRQI